jgi:hypothetical protein
LMTIFSGLVKYKTDNSLLSIQTPIFVATI